MESASLQKSCKDWVLIGNFWLCISWQLKIPGTEWAVGQTKWMTFCLTNFPLQIQLLSTALPDRLTNLSVSQVLYCRNGNLKNYAMIVCLLMSNFIVLSINKMSSCSCVCVTGCTANPLHWWRRWCRQCVCCSNVNRTGPRPNWCLEIKASSEDCFSLTRMLYLTRWAEELVLSGYTNVDVCNYASSTHI